jgi:hypothetical protein
MVLVNVGLFIYITNVIIGLNYQISVHRYRDKPTLVELSN